jgi:hypothetical protein
MWIYSVAISFESTCLVFRDMGFGSDFGGSGLGDCGVLSNLRCVCNQSDASASISVLGSGSVEGSS